MSRRRSIGYETLLKLWKERDGLCFYCDRFTYLRVKEIKRSVFYHGVYSDEDHPKSRKELASPDHIVPVVRGGKDDYNNLVLSCEDCNTKKADSTGEEFIQVKHDWGCDYLAVLRIDQDHRQKQRNLKYLKEQEKLKAWRRAKKESRRIKNMYLLFDKKLEKDRL